MCAIIIIRNLNIVGERGISISGGQKARCVKWSRLFCGHIFKPTSLIVYCYCYCYRIALARAVYSDADCKYGLF